MKRLALKLGLFLLLGAIINVAVAWGCANDLLGVGWDRDPSVPTETELADISKRHLAAGQQLINDPGQQFYVERVRRMGTLVDDCIVYTTTGPLYVARALAGWPLICFAGEVHRDYRTSQPTTDHVFLREHGYMSMYRSLGVGSATLAGQYHIIPFDPLWKNFAFNTILYAAILWLIYLIRGPVRRWRRIKRGLCPACAYPVGASAVCTECGKAVKA